jgi:hypothetical protein
MKDICFVELSANEQETLQGGSSPDVVNNVTSGASTSASQAQAQGQQAQQFVEGILKKV